MASLANGPFQYVSANASATTVTTAGVTTVTGHTLVAIVTCFTNKIGTTPITDNKSNTWVQAIASFGTTNGFAAMYYVASCTGGSGHTFTFTPTGSDFIAIAVLELVGMSASPLSSTSTSSSNTTSHNSGSITAGAADEFFIGASAISHNTEFASFAAGGRWVLAVNLTASSFEGVLLAWRLAQSGISDSFAWTANSGFNEAVMVAGFKVAAASGGSSGGSFTFFGGQA